MKNEFCKVNLWSAGMVILALVLAVTGTANGQSDYYVDQLNGDDGNDGLSWATAKATIQGALDLQTGACTIHTAHGYYHERPVLDVDGTSLLGGYPNGGGTRDPEMYETVLDGDDSGTVMTITGANVAFDGFVIRYGAGATGGGLYCNGAVSCLVSDCEIKECSATSTGGGVACQDSSVSFDGVTIRNHTCPGTNGGAGLAILNSSVTISNSVIRNNTATDSNAIAGGIKIDGSSLVEMTGNTISYNRAYSTGSHNTSAKGGGIYCAGELTLSNNEFIGNRAYSYNDGGYSGNKYKYSYGGALYCVNGSLETLSGNTYTSNSAYTYCRNTSSDRRGYAYSYGGAIYCEGGSTVSLTHETLQSNRSHADGRDTAYHGYGYAYAFGGALAAANNSEVTLGEGVVISGSLTKAYGDGEGSSREGAWTYGAVYLAGSGGVYDVDRVEIRDNVSQVSPSNQHVGGIFIDSTPTNIYNSIIVENTGDGIYLNSTSTFVINNTIAYNAGNGIYANSSGGSIVRNCILWGNTDDLNGISATYSDIQGGDAGEGNLDPPCMPLFVGGGDYHLLSTSCCIDRGSIEDIRDHDFDGDFRPYNHEIPDIGADETTAANPSPTPFHTPVGTPTPLATPGNDYYVDVQLGDDGNDGLTWGTAKHSIASALALAASSGGGNVHVAVGDYYENLIIGDNVRLFGGYNHGGTIRDPDTYITVIDGGNIDTVITIGGVSNVLVNGFIITHGRGDYGGGIHISSSLNVEISGNEIVYNSCPGSPGSKNLALGGGLYLHGHNVVATENIIKYNYAGGDQAYGGAIYCGGGGAVYVNANTINNNSSYYAGGAFGVGNPEGLATVSNNVIRYNKCIGPEGRGGAIYVDSIGDALFSGNTISNNAAEISGELDKTMRGGAIYCRGDLTLSGNTIANNQAYNYWNAGYNGNAYNYSYGGALYCASGCNVMSTENVYRDNQAYCYCRNTSNERRGYGYAYGGCVYCEGGSYFETTGDFIDDNRAYGDGRDTAYRGYGYGYAYGGAVYCANNSEVLIGAGTEIYDNTAQAKGDGEDGSREYAYSRGGGIAVFGTGSQVTIDRAIIRANQVMSSPDTESTGGGIYISESPVTLINTMVVENSSDGVYLNGTDTWVINDTIAYNTGYGVYRTGGSPVVRNCILWGNTDDLEGITATYSDVQGGDSGEGNLSPPCDPFFVGGGDYHLQSTSCCIDRGSFEDVPDHDFDGEYRPYNYGVPDIGADEVSAANPTPSPFSTPVGTFTPGPSPTPGIDFYVDGVYGDNGNDGLSWATAKATIGGAVTAAGAVGGGNVHVAGYEYYENVFCISNLTLLAGYPPGGGLRNPETYPTVIDAGNDGLAVTITGISNVEIDGFIIRNGRGEYGGGFYISHSREILIRNNTIQNNEAVSSPGSKNLALGGGLYLHGANIHVTDNLITLNKADGDGANGGGIYCGGGNSIIVSENTISYNTSEYGGGGIGIGNTNAVMTFIDNSIHHNVCNGINARGGAVYVDTHGHGYFKDNSISYNSASISGQLDKNPLGGGFYCKGTLNLEANTIQRNSAYCYYNASTSGHTYTYASGGGLYCVNGCDIMLSDNTIYRNSAYSYSRNSYNEKTSYAYSYGGGFYCENGSYIQISGDTVGNNTAYSYGRNTNYHSNGYAYSYGGGLYCANGSELDLIGGTVIENNRSYSYGDGESSRDYAYSYGGGMAIYGTGSDIDMNGITIRNNTLYNGPSTDALLGYGLYISESPVEMYNSFIVGNQGTGIYLNSSSPMIINNTIADNAGYGVHGTGGSAPTIRNCIFWGNTDDLEAVNAEYCNIQGGDSGEGNLYPPCNPLFVGEGDYHLLPNSCCIDRGQNTFAPTTDFDGDARPYNDLIVDIGADETQNVNPTPAPSITPYTPTPTGSPTATPAAEFYVDKTYGDDTNDGLSWGTAKASMNGALNIAVPGAVIHVAREVYYETMEIYSDTTLLGGYPKGGGVRDPLANLTIIDGGDKNTVVMIGGAENITIDGFTIMNGKQNYGGGLSCYACSHIHIKDCVFDSNEAGELGNLVRGGGAYFGACYDVWVHDCTFMNNQIVGSTNGYGAAVQVQSSSLVVIENNNFQNNTSSFAGGAVACSDVDDTVIITNNNFSGNKAYSTIDGSTTKGGAIYCDSSAAPEISYNTFTSNSAYTNARDGYARGGALFLQGDSHVYQNVIQSNQAKAYVNISYNGHLYAYAYGGALYAESNSALDFESNYLNNNKSYAYARNSYNEKTSYAYSYGGGVYCNSNSNTTVSDCTIRQNTAYSYGRNTNYRSNGYAYSYGGGIYLKDNSQTELNENTLIESNKSYAYGDGEGSRDYSYVYGGGMYLNDGVASVICNGITVNSNTLQATPSVDASLGNGIYIHSNNPIMIINSYITNNDGHGMYLNSSGSNIQIINDTFADNATHGIYNNSGSLSVINCILWNNGDDLNGVSATYSDIQDGDSGTGNISVDPEFIGSGDYHLSETSPCLETAYYLLEPDAVDFDFDGDARPQDTEFDMGADEYAGAPLLNLTVYLDGYYSGGAQPATEIDIELRSGSTPSTATTVVASYADVPLDASGQTGDVELTGCPSGSYFLTVHHLNHIQIITAEKIHVGYEDTAAVNLSDADDPNYAESYGYEPMGTEPDDMLSLRGGNANGDSYVNAHGDFIIWAAANGSTPVDPSWDERADYNGDDAVNSSDHSVWLNQNGWSSYVPDASKDEESGMGVFNVGNLELKVISYEETGEGAYIIAEVILLAEQSMTLSAVDAVVAYDPVFLGTPVLQKDYLRNGTTDFSLETFSENMPSVYHYCRAAMPGEPGVIMRTGENALFRIRLTLNKALVHSINERKLPIGLMPGISGAYCIKESSLFDVDRPEFQSSENDGGENDLTIGIVQ